MLLILTSYQMDLKVRGTDGDINAENVFIYAAWAEAPSIDLYGGGANAR